METYKVEIREVLSRSIEVQANDIDEAIYLAKEIYQSEEIVLDYNDLLEHDIIPFELKDEKENLIKKLIEYLYDDEKKHFEELDKPSEHIFLKLERLKALMD